MGEHLNRDTPPTVQTSHRLKAEGRRHFYFSPKLNGSRNAWRTLFKDDTWLESVMTSNDHPIPILLGADVSQLYHDTGFSVRRPPLHIALVVCDWDGDVRYLTPKLFSSFADQDFEYDPDLDEVRFHTLNITLHIGDTYSSTEITRMRSPSKLFQVQKNKLRTYALYYGDEELYHIGQDDIGGIRDFSTAQKKCVKHICSLKLRFRDGKPAYWIFSPYRQDMNIGHHSDWFPMNLISQFIKDENGKEWVKSWRLGDDRQRQWGKEMLEDYLAGKETDPYRGTKDPPSDVWSGERERNHSGIKAGIIPDEDEHDIDSSV